MFWALETGHADQIGLDRGFITAFPNAGPTPQRSRNPFTDDVARALADEANLRELDKLDPADNGLRDAWEAIVYTGRRCSEILTLKAGLHRPLPRPADALARPDQGRQLQRGHPHPRIPLRPHRRSAAARP